MLSWITFTNHTDASLVCEEKKAFEQTNRKFLSGMLQVQSCSH